jgi:hypothetical protein
MKRFMFLLAGLCSCITDDTLFDDFASDGRIVTAITIPRSELAASVYSKAPQTLKNPGKIYIFDPYLFVVEKYAGVHIINNADPAAPVNIGFISIPGCVDIAVKYNTLYADNATDLVAIDVSDPANCKVTSRTANVFPQLPLPDDVGTIVGSYDPINDVIIAWKDTTIN